MTYSKLLKILYDYKEEQFADFQRKLIFTKAQILGVRTPIMRKIAKENEWNVEELLSFPDEYFEVTFIKLAVVALLPYEKFVRYVEKCVSFIDNWACCDCFKAKCILKHKDEFLLVLQRLFDNGGEFYVRYVLVTLLSAYTEEKYLPVIRRYITQSNSSNYYVYMATAWLTAEIVVKYYDYGISILQQGILSKKTHNKAIQKAIESFRLTKQQKEYLRSLKIK